MYEPYFLCTFMIVASSLSHLGKVLVWWSCPFQGRLVALCRAPSYMYELLIYFCACTTCTCTWDDFVHKVAVLLL